MLSIRKFADNCAERPIIMRLLSIVRRVSPSAALLAKAEREAEAGRRLAIYDRLQGLLSPWYFRLRATEECTRSVRYEDPVSLIVIEASPDQTTELAAWIRRSLRSTDLACVDFNGFFYVLLTATDEQGSHKMAKRILSVFPVPRISIAVSPGERDRFQELLNRLHDRVRAKGEAELPSSRIHSWTPVTEHVGGSSPTRSCLLSGQTPPTVGADWPNLAGAAADQSLGVSATAHARAAPAEGLSVRFASGELDDFQERLARLRSDLAESREAYPLIADG